MRIFMVGALFFASPHRPTEDIPGDICFDRNPEPLFFRGGVLGPKNAVFGGQKKSR